MLPWQHHRGNCAESDATALVTEKYKHPVAKGTSRRLAPLLNRI
jgi:hypothetical protein